LQAKSFLPVLVPPIGYDSLKAVLGGMQVSKIGTEQDLDEIRDELEERLEIEIHKTPRWTSKKKKFLLELPELLKKIEFKGPVERKKYKKVLDEIEEYRKQYETLEQEREKQEELIEELKKAKDRESVRKIISKHSTAQEEFERLAEAANSALSPLRTATREALYYRARSESYTPQDHEWDDVRQASEHGEVSIDDDGIVRPDEGHSKVRRAIKALDALDEWLGAPPEDFDGWYRAEYKGARPSLHLRPFWSEHL
jgi:chromosome segregation ATPase